MYVHIRMHVCVDFSFRGFTHDCSDCDLLVCDTLWLNPEGGGSMILLNIGTRLQDYVASQSTNLQFERLSLS
jgi:hypothetical protein